MKSSTIALSILSVIASTNVNAAAFPVTSDQDNITIIGTQGAGYDLDGIAKDAVIGLQTANDATTKADNAQTTANQAQADATLAGLKADSANTLATKAEQDALDAGALADTADKKADTALQGVAKNGSDILDLKNKDTLQDGVLTNHDQRITALENQTPPKDGVDGKNGLNGKDGVNGKDGATGATGAQGVVGKNGVDGKAGKDGANGKDGKNGITTTITKKEVDTKTINQVKSLSSQTTAQAKDLKAAQQVFAQAQTNNNTQFKNLKNEVDDNKKQANAGISGAMAMAGLPQVQTNQKVMFAAGGATYNGESALAVGASVNFNENVIGKVSFSDDTANNMGASVGVGLGF